MGRKVLGSALGAVFGAAALLALGTGTASALTFTSANFQVNVATATAGNPLGAVAGTSTTGSATFTAISDVGTKTVSTTGSPDGTLTALSFTIGSQTFDLALAGAGTVSIEFVNGVFSRIAYPFVIFSCGTKTCTFGSDSSGTGGISSSWASSAEGNFIATGSFAPVAVPEPMTLALVGAGLVGIGAVRRRRQAA